MRRKGQILVIDDQETWRNELSASLQRSGFYVDTAATIAQALQYLQRTYYHVLVLDIRMDDIDHNNVEGMDFLDQLDTSNLIDTVKIVMLSAVGTKGQMRTAFTRYKIADFLSKDDEFDNEEFCKLIQDIVDKAHINLDLDILWGPLSPGQVVGNLWVGDKQIEPGTLLQARAESELDDLLCRLFFKSESIMVRPLSPGYSGTGVLWVQPFYATGGGGRAVVVKFGDVQKIKTEYNNFMAYVKPFVAGGRSTTIEKDSPQHTPLFGGIVYSLVGTASDRVQDFGSFYRNANISQVKTVLDHLFLDTCNLWYANSSPLQPHDLTADYQQLLGFTHEKLRQAMTRLRESVRGQDRLQFKALGDHRTFVNPLLATTGKSLVRPTYICTTHGDFNSNNILVDNRGQTWLIDFFRTGRGHILHDIAGLDSVIRFELLMPEEATLEERLYMEENLCHIDLFSEVETLEESFHTQNQALAKVYATIVHLRRLARQLVARNPFNDISELYIALLYWAMNTVCYKVLPGDLSREHALLCASLLAARLGL